MIFLTQFIGNNFTAGFFGDENQHAALATKADQVLREPQEFPVLNFFDILIFDEYHHLSHVLGGFTHIALNDLDRIRENIPRQSLDSLLECCAEHETLSVWPYMVTNRPHLN